MTIAVTQFDVFYSGTGKELTVEQVKERVARQIESLLLGGHVPRDVIIPVSGIWAYQVSLNGDCRTYCNFKSKQLYQFSLLLAVYQARVCRATEGGSESTNCRYNILSLLRKSDPVQAMQMMQSLPIADLCDQLEEASNIKLLENRYVSSRNHHETY